MNIKDLSLELLIHITKFIKDCKGVGSFFLCIKNLYTCVKSYETLLDEIKNTCLKKVVRKNSVYHMLGKLRHGEYTSWYPEDMYWLHKEMWEDYETSEEKIGIYMTKIYLLGHCFYKDGKKEGEWKRYHINGQLACECFYKNNKREGMCNSWYPDGTLEVSCNYKNGRKHGLYEKYHDDGQLEEECYYEDGKVDKTFVPY